MESQEKKGNRNHMPYVDITTDQFGCILNCAVRYAIGRRTYMPELVIEYARTLLPYINDKTLYILDQDITIQRYLGGYGDKQIDEPLWMQFHQDVISEETIRGLKPYKDWRGA